MDQLKNLLAKKKQELVTQSDSQKWVKAADLEAQKAQEYLKQQEEEEKKKIEAREKRIAETQEFIENFLPKKFVQKDPISGPKKQINLADANGASAEHQENEGEPPIKKEEVIKRLRALKQPITYFGETDWQRYERLKKIANERIDEGLKREGNTFHKDMTISDREFKSMVEVADETLEEEKIEKIFDKREQYKQELEAMDTRVRKRIGFATNISKEEKYDDVYYFIRRILRDWERELDVNCSSFKIGT